MLISFQYYAGTQLKLLCTCGGFLQAIFPFNNPTSGPKMNVAALTSASTTGQLGIMLALMMCTKTLCAWMAYGDLYLHSSNHT